jgi:uncharacterized protein involved in exopolysaccharide biosynthesis
LNALTSLPSVRELLADIFRNLRLIIVAMLVPPIIAVVLAYAVTPVYRADAKVLIKPGREFMPVTNLGENGQGGPSSSMAEVVKSEIEILNSQDIAQSVLQKLTIPFVYPDLAAKAEESDVPVLDRAMTIFDKQLGISSVELSNVVEVSFDSEDPKVATKVLETVLAEFQAKHVTLYSSTLSTPIEAQIAAKQKELEQLDAKRIQYQNANSAFSIPDQRASLIQQRAQVGSLLQDAQIREGALAEQVDFLKKSRAGTPQTSAIDSEVDPTSGTSSAAMDQLMALRQKEQELLQHYQPTAPAIVQIRQQVAQAEQFVQQAQSQNNRKVRTGANPLLATIDQQLLASQSELTPIKSQIEGYKMQVASLDEELRKLQDNELQVNDLQRHIDSLTADLQTLRTNLAQARLAENMDRANVSSVSIIDAPRAEPKPVFPKKILFGLGGVAMGIVASVLIILMSLSFGNTIITVEGAERILGTPVVAALPQLKALPAE